MAELLALIEGRNAPPARRTGARELLRLGWPEANARLITVLRNGDLVAKTAVAGALADLPHTIVPEFIAPLTAMLADADNDARAAAARRPGRWSVRTCIADSARACAERNSNRSSFGWPRFKRWA